jgi:4-amino-4-deoxy-L-arabinose transferase-like glycosyltransferase
MPPSRHQPNPAKIDLPNRLSALPTPILFATLFALVTLNHLTLLRLPYYWDEGGYYIPAALDFYHRFTLIPHFTNAHPPLPNVLLGTLWHITGPGILVTRIAVCAVAAAALTAVYRLAARLLDARAALALTLLTAVYPIWFAQSTLAHADIFAAAFTLWAFALYLPATAQPIPQNLSSRSTSFLSFCSPQFLSRRSPNFLSFRSNAEESAFPARPPHLLIATLFTLAALSKETAVVEPAILAAIVLVQTLRDLRLPHPCTALSGKEHTRPAFAQNLRWLATLTFPILPLIAWYAYHHHKTGFTFGNPEFLRYNATANLTLAHIAQALYYRAIHLFWQRNIWLPILVALACLFLPRIANPARLNRTTLRTIALLIAGNWIAFSILGGALLTRYLLPIYPLILLVCLDTWRTRTRWWTVFTAITAAAFISALWLNPPTAFAPEDNLTYRDMIVVHQNAIHYIAEHYPGSKVLTAWPVTTDLFNPWLGYTTQPIQVDALENFTLPEIQKAAQQPGNFDTALLFTTHYVSPALAAWYRTHPTTGGARAYANDRDLSPSEIAAMLHGTIVFQQQIGGEWAAVLHFNRTYEAQTATTKFDNP